MKKRYFNPLNSYYIKKDKNISVQVRYCFIQEDNTPLSFFVTGHVSQIEPFKGTNELVILTLSFTQQPPDDLILRLGQFIDTNENFTNRRDERIVITKDIFKIGKEQSYVDYWVSDNSAVSRSHANIIKKENLKIL